LTVFDVFVRYLKSQTQSGRLNNPVEPAAAEQNHENGHNEYVEEFFPLFSTTPHIGALK